MIEPRTVEELCALVKEAKTSFKVVGNETRGLYVGERLSLSNLNGIVFYEPAEMVVRAKAGTCVSLLENALKEKGQRLSFEPFDHRAIYGTGGEPTVGGMVAMNASGSRRIQVGACRDHLIGVQFVNGDGEVVKSGGRVMKDVTGLDLVKLQAGARGSLGVLTELTFKVQPLPEVITTLFLENIGEKQAIEALSLALGSPFDVTGAAHRKGVGSYIRLEGFGFSVTHRVKALSAWLSKFGALCEVDNSIWAQLQTANRFKDDASLWRISLAPDKMAEFTSQFEKVDYDWGGGLAFIATSDNLHEKAFQGHATLLKSPKGIIYQPMSHGEALITQKVKAAFDKRGIFA